MKTNVRLASLFVSGSLFLAGACLPALAGSAMNNAFVANVRPNIDFLDRSSRLALDTSSSLKVRAFARDEAAEQTIAGNSLVAWSQTNPRVAGATAAPLEVATNVTGEVTNGVDDVLTGRSVAIDTSPVTRTPAPDLLLPSGEADMARLSELEGRRFDALFVVTQKDALRQLATLYMDYVAKGDDPALRAIAERELPGINQRLARLRAL